MEANLERFIVFSRKTIPPFFRNFLIPFFFVISAIGLKGEFSQLLGTGGPFLLLYIPIILSAGIGGIVAGVVATTACAIAVITLYIYPYSFLKLHPLQILQITIFFFEGFIISTVIEALHVARDRARQAVSALRISQERYKLLVDNATEYAIFMLDKNGKVLSWNPGAQKLLGYSEKEIVGKNFSKFYIPEDKKKRLPKKELQQALQTGRSNDDNWIQKKREQRFWGSGMTMLVKNEFGQHIGFEKIIRDNTKLKEDQEKRDDFINIATHELRSPVTSINAYFSVLQKRMRKENNMQGVELVEKINNQLHKLTVLIQDLLDVGRIQNKKLAIHKEKIYIDELILEVIEELKQVTTTHTLIRKGRTRDYIFADRSRLNQVLINLITNAIKYSPHGKKIIISTGKKSGYAFIHITDFGRGIRKEDQEKIFERFFRAKTDENNSVGLGLGLFIAREIIKEHTGTLQVTSALGKGSTFSVKIPLYQKNRRNYTNKKTKKDVERR